jgi:hypothetical protein
MVGRPRGHSGKEHKLWLFKITYKSIVVINYLVVWPRLQNSAMKTIQLEKKRKMTRNWIKEREASLRFSFGEEQGIKCLNSFTRNWLENLVWILHGTEILMLREKN